MSFPGSKLLFVNRGRGYGSPIHSGNLIPPGRDREEETSTSADLARQRRWAILEDMILATEPPVVSSLLLYAIQFLPCTPRVLN